MPPWLDRLLADFEAKKPAALARAVSIVENHRDGYDALMGVLHPKIGRARRMGITGPPGAGKSTLTTLLIRELRKQGHTVGVIAVDPTSPFTGGALLGDRVRMESVSLDPGVFIRSMATRGSLGGLSAVTAEVADVLDAFGFDRVLIETVGVGQSELDIARTADTTVVVLVPESGDSIQTLKAGVMEIADIFVVNKADRPGADRLRNDIELMLGLRQGMGMSNLPAHHGVQLKAIGAAAKEANANAEPDANGGTPEPAIPEAAEGRKYTNPARLAREAARAESPTKWTPPVLRAVAAQEEGIEDLLGALERHFHYLESTGELRERRRRRLRDRVVDVVEQRLRTRLWQDTETNRWVDAQLPALEHGTTTPFEVADALLRSSGPLFTGTSAAKASPRESDTPVPIG